MRYTISDDSGDVVADANGRLAAIAIAKGEATRLNVCLHVRDSFEDEFIGTAYPDRWEKSTW